MYQQTIFGLTDAIVDTEKRILLINVPASDRPLMVEAPATFAVLDRVSESLPEHDESGCLPRRKFEHIR